MVTTYMCRSKPGFEKGGETAILERDVRIVINMGMPR